MGECNLLDVFETLGISINRANATIEYCQIIIPVQFMRIAM